MTGQTSCYQRDLESFAGCAVDEGAFHELWHGFDALRLDHAAGKVDAVTVGLGLRPHGPGDPPKPTIVVQLEQDLPGAPPPASAAGLPVHVETIGEVLAGGAPSSAFQRAYASPPCGVSIAPANTDYAGTLGFYVRDNDNRIFMVSCRHVLDPTLNGRTGGPGIQQPASRDGNVSDLSIAKLAYVGALDSPVARADVAAALVEGGFDPRVLASFDRLVTIPSRAARVSAGQTVLKSGRTTGATAGVVDLVIAQTRTNYGNGQSYLFTDCIGVARPGRAFYEDGDGGALLTDAAYQPVGMLFAGSVRMAFAHRIGAVLEALSAAAGPGAAFTIVTGEPAV